jgi:tryptophan synthase alpha chain
VIDDEARELGSLFRSAGLDVISLVAPTTSDERLEKIAGSASGFIYAVSRAGVTGTQDETSGPAEHLVRRARKFTELPIAVGFGISSRGQIDKVWRYADAAVVGSAIVAEIGRFGSHADLPKRIGEFVDQLIPARTVSSAEKI